MEERIKQFNEQKEALIKDLKLWVVDKSIPLEIRWNVFINSKLGEESAWAEDFEEIDSDNYFDAYYFNKYETITVVRLLEQAKDKKHISTIEQENNYKEDVLGKFTYSFQLDW